MNDIQPPKLFCAQCGGELHPDEAQVFITCSYCETSIYVDRSQVVFHWFINPTIDKDKAKGELFRWMSGNQTVKDLDKKSRIISIDFFFFPFWYFKLQVDEENESIILQSATATSISEISKLNIPAGDLLKYDENNKNESKIPNVPLEVALKRHIDQSSFKKINETALIHIPLFFAKYVYRNKDYTALIEGGTGEVFADVYPEKDETPYYLLGGVTAIIYIILALIPASSMLFDPSVTTFDMLIAVISGIIIAPILFLIAKRVVSKV
ncbi:MAG TPA: hypothetical protein VFC41_00605 [Anaerovoracaceae bacterium]|nr:hypothetical protein [Anaerovoracaceae bacterium]